MAIKVNGFTSVWSRESKSESKQEISGQCETREQAREWCLEQTDGSEWLCTFTEVEAGELAGEIQWDGSKISGAWREVWY
jgi:hypothetical protein